MSAHRTCYKCGGSMTSNGGADHTARHSASHAAMHGFQHGSLLLLAIGAVGTAIGRLFPEKLTCDRCGYSVHA